MKQTKSGSCRNLESRALGLAATTTLVLACASTEPLPEPIDPDSTGLGIALDLRLGIGPIRSSGTRPETVLFVRLEEGESLADLEKKSALIPSTCVRGDYAYLLNAPPGTYVAVAAVYVEDVGPTEVPMTASLSSSVSVGYKLELSDGKVTHRSYFSRDMIARSLTTVPAGSFAFMGSYEADQPFLFGEPDDLQLHFLHVLEGADVDRAGFFADMANEGRSHCLALHAAKKDREAERLFRHETRELLEDTAWIQRVEASMAKP